MFAAINGTPQLIASITGYPNPSYKELTKEIELFAYSSAIPSFVKPVLNLTSLSILSSLMSLDVCPSSFDLPITIK